MKRVISSGLIFFVSITAFARDPDCTGADRWPANMAFTNLRNEGILDADLLDYSKPTVKRLASEKVGKDRYRQVHLVTFVKKSGEKVFSITVNEVSHQECSITEADVYMVSKRLGGYTEEKLGAEKPQR